MGIAKYAAQILIREHAWKPIRGDVFLLGRQTMLFNRQEAIDIIKDCGVTVAKDAVDTGLDKQTVAAQMHADAEFIRDSDFFSLLGVPHVRCLDHSDYEGADLIHDLNLPISQKLEGVADFILDGSTLDNVFDPATVLKNISRMLKPGGRLLSFNMASNHNIPYTLVSPTWLFDYFVANKYADCRVYISVHDGKSGVSFYAPNAERLATNAIGNLNSNHLMGLICIAEKGAASTWDALPDQGHYRSDEKWREYTANIQPMVKSVRPDACRSFGPLVPDISLFHGDDFRWIDGAGQRHVLGSPAWEAAKAAAVTLAAHTPGAATSVGKPASPALTNFSSRQMLREVMRRFMRRVTLKRARTATERHP